jgi:hypothetical protein
VRSEHGLADIGDPIDSWSLKFIEFQFPMLYWASGTAVYLPQGRPTEVRPPGSEDFEARAA